MSPSFIRTTVFFGASAIALSLFLLGTSYPLSVRVSGDAHGYLAIAEGFTNFASAFNYAGDRTLGLPLFAYAVHRVLSIFSPTVYLLPWINAIGIVMLLTHITASWLFSTWARSVALIKSQTACYLLFAFLATCPALVGHTTSPLSDTFAVDFLLFGLAALSKAHYANQRRDRWLYCGISALCLGFSVLVRPGSILGILFALLVCSVVSLWVTQTSRVTFYATLLGFLIVLAPATINCTQKYGAVCLQSPKTFVSSKSMQDGLRGARMMWTQNNEFPGSLPLVKDEMMFNQYYRRCQIDSVVGLGETSLTGCLLSRPFSIPAFVGKKWMGLFDHFRFSPYLEQLTPGWLVNLGRLYGALAWTGLCLCFVVLFSLMTKRVQANTRAYPPPSLTILFLALYTGIMLLQHTALHTEERYGFVLVPLSTVALIGIWERTISQIPSSGWKKVLPLLVFCIFVLAIFAAQINAWDQASFGLSK